MEPYTIVIAFASIASGVALVRVLAEYRQSSRELRRIAIRHTPAIHRFRTAADTLRRQRGYY